MQMRATSSGHLVITTPYILARQSHIISVRQFSSLQLAHYFIGCPRLQLSYIALQFDTMRLI